MMSGQYDQDAEAVRAGLGPDVIGFSAESIYEWGPVFNARLAVAGGGTVDAVVKRTLSDPAQAAALGDWQRHLGAAGLSCVRPLQLQTVALPMMAGGAAWMAYPWIEGSSWSGSVVSTAAAGRGLGLLHRESSSFDGPALPHFDWPVFGQESVDEDVEAIEKVCRQQAEALNDGQYRLGPTGSATRWVQELEAFHADTLPKIRDAELPAYAVSLDYRATNLIYTGDGRPRRLSISRTGK